MRSISWPSSSGRPAAMADTPRQPRGHLRMLCVRPSWMPPRSVNLPGWLLPMGVARINSSASHRHRNDVFMPRSQPRRLSTTPAAASALPDRSGATTAAWNDRHRDRNFVRQCTTQAPSRRIFPKPENPRKITGFFRVFLAVINADRHVATKQLATALPRLFLTGTTQR